jgi:rhamnogalacturonyl hydrolase YesR
MKALSTPALLALLSATQPLAVADMASISNASSLAFQMVDSSIARGQGLYGSTASTSWIELGIFQQALRESIAATNETAQKTKWQSYLEKSLNSIITPLSNSTADAGLPLDRLSIGSNLLIQYAATGDGEYVPAIAALQKSVLEQQRNANGGLWYYANPTNLSYYHNLSYLDGMYSIPRFAVLSSLVTNTQNSSTPKDCQLLEPADALKQLTILKEICQRPSSGLLVHGYDASKAHNWSNHITGASPDVWGRSQAWYTLGTVGTLQTLQSTLANGSTMIQGTFDGVKKLFNSILEPQVAAAEHAKNKTGSYGVWQVVDRPGDSGNFVEASASCMTVYSSLHGVRLGLVEDEKLQARAVAAAKGIYQTVLADFLIENENGTLSLSGTSSVASLSGEGVNYEVCLSPHHILGFGLKGVCC